ncbi:MAG: capsular polysaccharide synthesis protein [Chitinivibrionia bacterium]|nr:capsular polysaccharide synthesis protein [Chitinivibrionia bacterium]
MSVSQNITKFYTKTAVLFLRLTGKSKNECYSLKGEMLVNYFARKHLKTIENLPQKAIAVEKSPEIIWQFWDNPTGKKTPEIVKSSLETVKKFKGNFEHKILNNSTIENYSDLPGYILDKLKKGHIDYAHFSDLLRLNLLKNHGGIWLDATAYMTNFVPQYIADEDFFVFLTGNLTHFPYSFMQNCFIRSKKGNFLCEAWYEMCVEFWKKETKTLDYFQHQLMFKALVLNNPTAKNLFEKMPHISEDQTHQLVGDNLIRKFDENEWAQIKGASFFQKTRYKIKRNEIACSADYSDTYFSMLCNENL